MATEHSHGPNFGRKVNDCPRCTELTNGAEPVRWNSSRGDDRSRTGGYPTTTEIHAHFAPGSPHHQGACGPVCTFGDW